jgi:hypothetical protein
MEKTAHTLNRDIVWAKAEYARAGFKFQKVMVVEGFALYFLIGMQFMIIAMSAKGYGIFLGMVAALISWFTSPLLVLLCLFLVPARKGVFLGR